MGGEARRGGGGLMPLVLEEPATLPLIAAALLYGEGVGADPHDIYAGLQLAASLMREAPEWWIAAERLTNADKPAQFALFMQDAVRDITATVPLEIVT